MGKKEKRTQKKLLHEIADIEALNKKGRITPRRKQKATN